MLIPTHPSNQLGSAKSVPISDLEIRNARIGTTLWDDVLKGFGVRIGKQSKTFIVLIDSGRRKRIGRYPLVTLSDARKEAKRILAEKELGRVYPTHTAYDDAKEAYLADCAARLRSSTVELYRRHLTVHFSFGRKSVADITSREILQRLKGLKPSEKEHAFRHGRTFFRWCRGQHLIDVSPMERLDPPPAGKARERFLSADELRDVYRTAWKAESTLHRLVLLLIHTGQRKGEITGLKWENVASDRITLPSELTKNGREHTFPIAETVRAFLDGIPQLNDNPYVLPVSRSHVRGKGTTTYTAATASMRAFKEECHVEGWTLHDLRRTFATNLQALGVSREVIEALLNHVSGKSAIVGVYQRYDYFPEMTVAIAAWEQYLSGLLHSCEVASK